MAMRVTQKEIKRYLYECGTNTKTVDCTHMGTDDYKKIIEEEGWLEEVAYSCGVYGCNGAFFIGHNTGNYYIITTRSTALFIFH